MLIVANFDKLAKKISGFDARFTPRAVCVVAIRNQGRAKYGSVWRLAPHHIITCEHTVRLICVIATTA